MRTTGGNLEALCVALVLATGPAVADEPATHSYAAGLDLSYIAASGNPSWLHGSAGKLRYDDEHEGFALSRAFADYRWRVAGTLDLNLAAEAYGDGVGDPVDVTQAYLEWRPLNLSPNRYRLKVGAFYPRLSLENSGPGWSSPYTISSSAINTWIGEEIRVIGTEFSVSRRPQSLGGAHTFSLTAAAFVDNDPAGGLIAWKGWSVHDRQTSLFEELPLPPLPQIQPDGMFFRQDPVFVPFQEQDGNVGWYANAEWQYSSRLLVRALRYDNRADPINVTNGQYGWYTAFTHLGLQADLPGDFGLIMQWLRGGTEMGPVIGGARVVDVGYQSEFVLLTKALGQHRVSARYDRFEATEDDATPLDENREQGYATTLAWKFSASDHVQVAAEWLRIHTSRPAWAYNALPVSGTEQQVQLSLQLRFGNR